MSVKICHMTSVHPHTDTRIFLKECKSLSDSGYETHLIAPDAPEGIINGVYTHAVKKTLGSRLKRMTKTVWRVYSISKQVNADVYHFHDPELIPIGLLLRFKGKKVIYDVHEDVPRQILSKFWIPKYLRKFIAAIYEVFENYAVKYFDGIITATPHINKRFLLLGCQAINVNNYPLLKELQVSETDWSKKEQAVCYVGGIGKIRGIFEMIESVNLTDVKLLLGGKFSNNKERDLAIQMDGWGNVIELGYLNREKIVETYSKSLAGLVVLHPVLNYLDALPVKMFEYMSSGIPVIASNFPLWKEIIETNNAGLCVDPLNPEEIAKAIQWIVDHPDEAKNMGENGRKAIEEHYNWEAESKKLINLYKHLENQ